MPDNNTHSLQAVLLYRKRRLHLHILHKHIQSSHSTSHTSTASKTQHKDRHSTPKGNSAGSNTVALHHFQEAYVSRTLYICKLPPDFTEEELQEACTPFGDIRNITSYPARQISFIEYVSRAVAVVIEICFRISGI